MDLIERLRTPGSVASWAEADAQRVEAAEEIERLRDDRAAAVAATRTLFRAALLQEAAKWTGDFRMPAHKALCDAAKLAGVPLTLDECYLATKRA